MSLHGIFLTATGSVFLSIIPFAAEGPTLKLSPRVSALEFSWPRATRATDGSLVRPFFELERSEDLQKWSPVGERVHDPNATEEAQFKMALDADDRHNFYRLQAFEPRLSKLVQGGAEVFGYSEAFAKELARIGQISLEEFEQAYSPQADYLPQLTWEATTARHWNSFSLKPGFQLNAPELGLFRKNGFVVSERLGARGTIEGDSFADVFYSIWHNDLPVFISSDAVLQAWHRTYDAMIEELEETYLFNSIEEMLRQMADHISTVATEAGEGALKESVRDVDYYLAVARSLLAGNQIAAALGQEARVAETLSDVRALAMKPTRMFGECRMVDFSQFQVRGHYTHTPRLGHYFRCIMWLGRTDFVVAGGPFERCPGVQSFASPREIGNAIVLWDLLRRSGQMEAWLRFDRIVQAFVGWSDSLNFAQLGSLLVSAGIQSIRDIPDIAKLQSLQQQIAAGQLGVQHIRSDFIISPLGPEQVQLPRAFHFFGQKFVPDSWAFAKVVFDDVRWVENGITNEIQRRVPSALDVAFSVLGNDQVVPDLVDRMLNTAAAQSTQHAERWRDGLPYQHNLAAVRAVIDSQDPAAWKDNIYMSWLHTLRQLSEPTTGAIYPEAMRTRAWAMKTLNTQLASWTHLRHDTILYAKQSYTAGFVCYYPEGYVEPRTQFWRSLAQTAERAASLIENLPYTGSYSYVSSAWEGSFTNRQLISRTNRLELAEIKAKQVQHMQKFADTMSRLASLSEKQLAQVCFDQEDELFIRNLIQNVGMLPFGSGGVRKFDGWYPQLFYRGVQFDVTAGAGGEIPFQESYGANAADRVVADVHTDVPSPAIGDMGGVLHQGIGQVNLLMIAVDHGGDRAVYAGPVLSHYEFEVTGNPTRLTDFHWEGLVPGTFGPTFIDRGRIEGLRPPPWTTSYLVPLQ